MRGGSGGGGSVSARSLSSDATGGCPGEPGWSAGRCEMVPTSGWRERAGFPGQPVGLCGLARRRERPERAASGIAPGPRGAAAPLRLKARPGPGPVPFCPEAGRSPERALLAPGLRFVRNASAAGGPG